MKIKEGCDIWTLEFNHNSLDIELTPEQQLLLKNVMHTAGESLSVMFSLPTAEIELRNQILEAVASIFNDVRKQIQVAVEFTIMNQAINTPLGEGFTNDELFGENLTDSLKAALKNQEEFGIAGEYLQDEDEEDEEENT